MLPSAQEVSTTLARRIRAASALLQLCVGCVGCVGSYPSRVDNDGDGWFAGPEGGDCDDLSPSVHPTHPESCDGEWIDNDCDGVGDGHALPWTDRLDDGMAEGWNGDDDDSNVLEPTEHGATVLAPFTIQRELGAECWSRQRMSVEWWFAESASFTLRLLTMTGGTWDSETDLPDRGYMLEWVRQGTTSTTYHLYRLTEGEQELLNHSDLEPGYGYYEDSPYVLIEAMSDDDEQTTSVQFSSPGRGFNDILLVKDRADDRPTTGGVGLSLVDFEGSVELRGVYLEAL